MARVVAMLPTGDWCELVADDPIEVFVLTDDAFLEFVEDPDDSGDWRSGVVSEFDWRIAKTLTMELQLDPSIAADYKSASQIARVVTEQWAD